MIKQMEYLTNLNFSSLDFSGLDFSRMPIAPTDFSNTSKPKWHTQNYVSINWRMHPLPDLRYACQKLIRAKCKKARMSFASMVACYLSQIELKCHFFSWGRYFSEANLTSVDIKDVSFKNAKPEM
jgi:uncharacterized protein YjbI with pentapeptide repeats